MCNTLVASNASSWRVAQFSAQFETAHLSGNCQLLTPSAGLHGLHLEGAPLTHANLLGLRLPAATALEAYARLGDLVAIYSPTEARPFRSQAYWRLASHAVRVQEHEALSAIELVASQQTDLLDSRPDLSVGSELASVTTFRLTDVATAAFDEIDLARKPVFSRASGIACFLFRLPGNAVSYVEIVHPLDFETTQLDFVNKDGTALVRTTHHLFAQRLEKGVILRARVLGLFVNRCDEMRSAAAHYARFAASDPPLTT